MSCAARIPWAHPPAQAIPVDEYDPAQDPPIIDPGLAMALGKIRRQTRHLLVR
jgi:hypothetical protein